MTSDPVKALILGPGKSGTTILLEILKKSVSGDTVCFFEPAGCRLADTASLDRKNVLSKVLLNRMLGYGPFGPDACSFFNKRIFLQRDPRDLLISNFLYSALSLSVTSDFWKFSQMVSALRAKEQHPESVSYLDLFKLLVRLSGGGICPTIVVEQYLKDLRFAADVRRLQGDRFFRFRYEDLVDHHLETLEEYLGVPLTPVQDVDPQYRRVARSKAHGDWRNWFLPEDVEFFRPRLDEYLLEMGYQDDWELPAKPEVTPQRASGYLMRLAADRGKFQAIEYDVDSFAPENNPIVDPSLDRRSYEIPRIRAQKATVSPAHGAHIVDPRIETPDGRRVNVLVRGEPYVYRYRVEFTEDTPGVSCGMAISDLHGDTVGVNAAFHHHEVVEKVAKGAVLQAAFDFQCRLRPGVYFLNAGVTTTTDGVAMSFVHRIVNALVIVVRSVDEGFQSASPRITMGD
jgi:hypothetical protein